MPEELLQNNINNQKTGNSKIVIKLLAYTVLIILLLLLFRRPLFNFISSINKGSGESANVAPKTISQYITEYKEGNIEAGVPIIQVSGDIIYEQIQEPGGVEDVNWVKIIGDTMTGTLIMDGGDINLGLNNIITGDATIESSELSILDEGIDFNELQGQLGDDQISYGAVDLDSGEVAGVLGINKGGTYASSFSAVNTFIWYDGTRLVASPYSFSSFMPTVIDYWVDEVGDTMTGNLIMSGSDIGIGVNPVYSLHVISGDLISASFDGRVIGVDAVNSDEFVTLNQLVSIGGLWIDEGSYIYPTDAGASAMTILDSGNVGIGITNPLAKLNILDNTGNPQLRLSYDETNTCAYSTFYTDLNGDLTIESTFIQMPDCGGLVRQRNILFPSSYLGIGTTVPDNVVEINSASGNNLRLTYGDSDGAASNYADFLMSSSGDLTISPSGNGMYFQNGVDAVAGIQFLDADGGTPILNIDTTNENVGIGSGAPTAKLTVAQSGTANIVEFLDGTDQVLHIEDGGNIIVGSKPDAPVPVGSWSTGYDGSQEGVYSSAEFNGYLYIGTGSYLTGGEGDVYMCDPTLGGDITQCDNIADWILSFNGTQEYILSLVSYNGMLYAGQGIGTGDGDVYVCNPLTTGNANTCETGDWSLSYNGTQEGIYSLAEYNEILYAGQGGADGGSDGNIYMFDGASWTLSYTGANNSIFSLGVYEGHLYAGEGWGAGDGNVLMCQPTLTGTLTVCDDASEWSTSYNGGADWIVSMSVFDNLLFVGQGTGAGTSGDVYYCNSRLSGDLYLCDSGDWSLSFDGLQDTISSLAVFNGSLYAGQGNDTGDGDIYKFDGSGWSLSFDGSQEMIETLVTSGNYIYAGQSHNAGDADVFYLGGKADTSYTLVFQAGSGIDTMEGKLWFANESLYGTSGGAGANVGVFKMSHSLITTAGAYDIAEDYYTEDLSIEAGDVVSIGGTVDVVEKTFNKYQKSVLGVVSTAPAMRLSASDTYSENQRPIALAGRVPVKVTTENGPIDKGDFLTPSSKSGFAMKACGTKFCEPGMIIGTALESFNNSQRGDSSKVLGEFQIVKDQVNKVMSSESQQLVNQLDQPLESGEISIGEGRIMMFVNLTWYDPVTDTNIDSDNEIYLGVQDNLLESENFSVDSKGNLFSGGNMEILGVTTLNEVSILKSLNIIGDTTLKGSLKIINDSGFEIVLNDVLGNNAFEIKDINNSAIFALDYEGNLTKKGAEIIYFKNNSGRKLSKGEVVILDTLNSDSVRLTTKELDKDVIGVVVEDSDDGDEAGVAVSGRVQVYYTGTLSIGDFVVTSSQEGRVIKLNQPYSSEIVLGRVLEVEDGQVLILITR